jgi:hypothetical protein
MMLKTQEHQDLISMFERTFKGRFDKNPKQYWAMGQIYQDGTLNELFLAYRHGYAYGKAIHREAAGMSHEQPYGD